MIAVTFDEHAVPWKAAIGRMWNGRRAGSKAGFPEFFCVFYLRCGGMRCGADPAVRVVSLQARASRRNNGCLMSKCAE